MFNISFKTGKKLLFPLMLILFLFVGCEQEGDGIINASLTPEESYQLHTNYYYEYDESSGFSQSYISVRALNQLTYIDEGSRQFIDNYFIDAKVIFGEEVLYQANNSYYYNFDVPESYSGQTVNLVVINDNKPVMSDNIEIPEEMSLAGVPVDRTLNVGERVEFYVEGPGKNYPFSISIYDQDNLMMANRSIPSGGKFNWFVPDKNLESILVNLSRSYTIRDSNNDNYRYSQSFTYIKRYRINIE